MKGARAWLTGIAGTAAAAVAGALSTPAAVAARIPPAASVALPSAVQLLAADGPWAAASVQGQGPARCGGIVLWRAGAKAPAARVPTQLGCAQGGPLEGMAALALAGKRVLWLETNGGNNLELIVRTATLADPAHPRQVAFQSNGDGAGGDPGGSWAGHLHAQGSLLVYAEWNHCEPAEGAASTAIRACGGGQPDLYDGELHALVAGTDRVVLRGTDALEPLWVDGGRILVRRADGSLALLRGSGSLLHAYPADVGTPGAGPVLAAAFQGTRLVLLRARALDVLDAATGRSVRSFPLAALPGRRLAGLQSGIALLASGGAAHLVRLDTGRGLTVALAASPCLTQAGLFSARGSRVEFRPLAGLRAALGPAAA